MKDQFLNGISVDEESDLLRRKAEKEVANNIRRSHLPMNDPDMLDGIEEIKED